MKSTDVQVMNKIISDNKGYENNVKQDNMM